jgi:hypothetical protein
VQPLSHSPFASWFVARFRQPATFHAETRLVALHVTVTNESGELVTDLDRSAFRELHFRQAPDKSRKQTIRRANTERACETGPTSRMSSALCVRNLKARSPIHSRHLTVVTLLLIRSHLPGMTREVDCAQIERVGVTFTQRSADT